MRLVTQALLLFTSCAPAIVVPASAALEPLGHRGRGVEVCVLMQERTVRRRYEGTADLSFEPWEFGIASVAVKHPSAGLVIIDPAFGKTVGADLSRTPKLFATLMGPLRDKTPMVEVMRTAGLDPLDVQLALATHVHWDHVGALGDLPNARVLLAKPELEWARTLSRYLDEGVMPHHLFRARERLAQFEFKGPPRDGFASSFDVFGDGSVVAVPLPGHTPGSTAFFLSLTDGRTVLLTGDTSWTWRGIEAPVHKNPLTPFDADLERTGSSLGLLHALHEKHPEWSIIPAHDAAALERLPRCGGPT